jgi:hypothetical protein
MISGAVRCATPLIVGCKGSSDHQAFQIQDRLLFADAIFAYSNLLAM